MLALLLLLGCTDAREPIDEETPLKSPPGLTISVGEETITPVLGSYSWSYDRGDGTATGEHADSAAPPDLVEGQKVVNVNTNTKVRLNFEIQPAHYQVRIWNSQNDIIRTDNTVVLSGFKGKAIYEVLATWGQGTASYAFALNVKED
ncbi:hypothetical protein AM500_04715 [Bacillus sp. FJAT-18017]|nr:hypothetical protein AM500_04715 [Bacillus sp. FJAT-18017]